MAAANTNPDRIIYGATFAVALIAGGIAIASDFDGEEVAAPAVEADPVAAARAREQAEARRTSIVLEVPEDAGTRALPDFVPDLPAVPDLASQPPPARAPVADDPRMETLVAEMRVLSHARTLLGEHPAEALGVIEQHRRQYPHGVLREEREAFAIEALLALEHPAEAERRYYDFLRDFPESEHTESLARAMARPPHAVGASGR